MTARVLRSRAWLAVLASALGLMVGPSIHVFSFGVFLKPVSGSLGVSRAFLSLALLTSLTLTALACPLVGALVDRWGVRRVVAPAIILFAMSTAALSLMQRGHPVLIILLYGLQGLFAAGQSPATYPKAITGWFDKERGLALGVAMAGVGLGMALAPKLAGALILAYGWRVAYLGLGVTVLAVGFLPVLYLLREPPRRPIGGALASDAAESGVSFKRAISRDWRFWALALAFFLAAAAINGTLTSLVALLTDRGVAISTATSVLAVSGLAAVAGRILCGFALDRVFGPYVAIAALALPMVGIGLLASGAVGTAPLFAALLCGLGVGAELDLMPFLISRYFGLTAFGKVHGLMFGVFSIGTGLGPYFMGLAHDRLGSYLPMLTAFTGVLLVSCLMFSRLGPYPFPRHGLATSTTDPDWLTASSA